MRIKVAIDVTAPLKKEWRVRTSNGKFLTINFKYEKLGVFCHRCGMLGHTDKVCPELFELNSDDGVRNWGVFLKLVPQRIGTAATNRWLQDPIPTTMPSNNQHPESVPAGHNNNPGGTMHLPNLNERMLVVQSQITSIKHGMLAVQTAAQAKQAAGASSSCQIHLLPSSSTATSASNLLQRLQLVLGLPAASFPSTNNEGIYDENGLELKKRKRMLALQNGESLADGDMGNDVIGTNVSQGGMLI